MTLQEKIQEIENSIHDPRLVIGSTPEEIRKCLESGLSYIIPESGELIGYTLAYGDAYNYAAYIEKLYTREDFRGMGYQKQTLQWSINQCRERGYHKIVSLASPDNPASNRLFEIFGFKLIGKVDSSFGFEFPRNLYELSLK